MASIIQSRLHHRLARDIARTIRRGPVYSSRQLSDASTSTVTDAQPSSSTQEENIQQQEGWLFVDSVFPIRLGAWDIRHYIGAFRQEDLLERLHSVLSGVKTHGFKVLSLEPHPKDGGVFVRYQFSAKDTDVALLEIEKDVREHAAQEGGVPSWAGLGHGSVWLVRGRPWKEDMNRYASPVVKFSFEGPDVKEESLWSMLRQYGRIQDVTLPAPVPAGTLRSSTVTFPRVRSAVIARNAIHGLKVSPEISGSSSPTRLHAVYERPIQAHVIRDWLAGHPRIVLPILVFLLGSLTYTIFDPIRALMIEGKLLNWFDYREFKAYKWLRANALERFSLTGKSLSSEDTISPADVWKERKDAESSLRSYLSDMPSTVSFVHGPQGSGKTRMLSLVLKDVDRKALVIDCAELNKATSDSRLVAGLAQQTGYWPIFTFLNSMNSIIDLASMGLIGQKAGLSSSLTDQLKQILEVVGTALKGVNHSHRIAAQRKVKEEQKAEARKFEEDKRRENIRRGTWHDGRIDCIAGNGIMSELGVGDESLTWMDSDSVVTNGWEGEQVKVQEEASEKSEELARRQKSIEEVQAVSALPILVIKNFAARGGAYREELLEVLTQWAATLADNQIAHVIVVSDNRENAKRFAKALTTKPLNFIALYDADASSALSFVKQKLDDASVHIDFTSDQTACIEKLGGRASDLESLIHKVRSGQKIEEAVEDIVGRGVGELRKNVFGDDLEDAKSLPWSREQAWIVLRELSKHSEIPYYDILLEFPFKGDEAALRRMEHAEFIAIGTHNGRPSTIKPGKPVYRYVFERLVNDPIFRAIQEISFNEKIISSTENTVKACESELSTLRELSSIDGSSWWNGNKATSERSQYLLKKMATAGAKIENLERRNTELKKVLSKCE